jgi:glycosyltransferase involved in cell wall biosynthesis
MISVILCTYNRAESLKQTLASLAAMSVPSDLRWELVIVDNNSRDHTKAVVEEFAKVSGLNVKYLFEKTQGLSHARNAGIREADGDILSFIDDDVTVDQNWLGHLTATFDQTGCMGVGGRIVAVWLCEKPRWFQEHGPYRMMKAIVSFDLGGERHRLTTPPFGANMSFKRAAFDKYGLFRTDLGRVGNKLLSCEDTEFGKRLLRGNETLIYDPGSLVYHPVEDKRTKKKYFQSWYFNYGRVSVRLDGIPKGTSCYFGVPRQFYRHLVGGVLRSLLAFNSRRYFYYKLQICQVLGQIVGAYEIYREHLTDSDNVLA